MSKKSSKKASKEKENIEQELPLENVEEKATENKNEKEDEAENVVKEEEKEQEEDPISELTKKIETINDKYIRLSAEFDNYRKRTLKEKMELTKSAGASIILSLLPVIDDFDRALSHLDEARDLAAVKAGILLINNKFQDFLSQQGVREIESKNTAFDTDHHEAITKIPAPEESMKGKVIDCVEKGYMLNDKVIRFSKVVVGE